MSVARDFADVASHEELRAALDAANARVRELELAIESGREAERRYQLMYEAGRELSSTLDLGAICDRLRRLVADLIPCDGMVISSYSPEDDLMRCEYVWADGKVLDPQDLPPMPLNREGLGLQSQVILGGKPMVFNDVADRVRKRKGQFYRVSGKGDPTVLAEEDAGGPECALMVPINVEGQVTGVVQLMSDDPDSYRSEHVEILDAIVSQLSVAIQNARLYRRVLRELDERRKAEAALTESEAQFRLLTDSAPVLIWVNGPEGCEFVNNEYLRFFGKTLDEVRGFGWKPLLHSDDQEAYVEAYRSAVDQGTAFHAKARAMRADGQYRWIDSFGLPRFSESGEVIGMVGSSTDVQELLEAQDEVQRLNSDLERRVLERTKELESANREMEGFTYSVSHDLRAPLRGMVAHARMLEEDFAESLPPDAQAHLQRIASAANKMAELIDDLLHLSRIARQEMLSREVDLSEIANEVAFDLEAANPGKVAFDIQENLVVMGDANLLRLAVENLLENAVKFSGPGGRVTLAACQTARGPAFLVRDEGIGFDLKYHDRIFLPFERLHRDQDYPGTGVGLANVKRIVERHGGTVWAESQPERGATFFFTLAGRPSEASATDRSAASLL